MTLSSQEMKVLEAESASFAGEHNTYLAQAIDAIRRSGDPQAAARLLRALSRSRDARPKQKTAQVHVSRWIVERVRSEPEVAAERIILELGWLRRLSVARNAELLGLRKK